MRRQESTRITILPYLAVSLAAAILTAFFLTMYYSRLQFNRLGAFFGEILKAQPDARQTVLEALKTTDWSLASGAQNSLQSYGYQPADFSQSGPTVYLIAFLAFLIIAIMVLFLYWYWHRTATLKIRTLTDYLESINTGHQGTLLESEEGEFSKLQDEIYKTVTALYQTRDAALSARNKFADHLADISHQLKTPITAISLSVQMMKHDTPSEHLKQIQRQLHRLTYLEEALLLLSRIDSGTLSLKRTKVDVFTLLTLASDNLQELSTQEGISITIPENGEAAIDADLDWTMEAIMNLMKNCMEHSPAGTAVHCSYETNPLYVQIRIWDEGPGFEKEDLPHLFERFYRGKTAKKNSIGIGLSLSREIIEMQNGLLSADNLPAGGAVFEIRFYSH